MTILTAVPVSVIMKLQNFIENDLNLIGVPIMRKYRSTYEVIDFENRIRAQGLIITLAELVPRKLIRKSYWADNLRSVEDREKRIVPIARPSPQVPTWVTRVDWTRAKSVSCGAQYRFDLTPTFPWLGYKDGARPSETQAVKHKLSSVMRVCRIIHHGINCTVHTNCLDLWVYSILDFLIEIN